MDIIPDLEPDADPTELAIESVGDCECSLV